MCAITPPLIAPTRADDRTPVGTVSVVPQTCPTARCNAMMSGNAALLPDLLLATAGAGSNGLVEAVREPPLSHFFSMACIIRARSE